MTPSILNIGLLHVEVVLLRQLWHLQLQLARTLPNLYATQLPIELLELGISLVELLDYLAVD